MKRLLQISASIGGLLFLIGLGVGWQKIEERIPPKETTQEAIDFFDTYDAREVIEAATKEYIIDSIEEVNTQARWKEQQAINAMMLDILMRLDTNVRLDVRQTYEIKKLYEEGH